jgi:hypothetical protein
MARPSRRASLALAVSLAVHVLIALAFSRVPGPSSGSTFDTRVSDDRPGLSISLPDPPRSASRKPAAPTKGEASHAAEADFSVAIHDPFPETSAPELRVPVIVSQQSGFSASASSATATGGTGKTGGRASLLDAPPQARTVVYVLDRSLSMGPEGALGRARRELLASLARLPAGSKFQVILYNRQCEPLRIEGRSGFLPADEKTRHALAAELDRIAAAGNTDHFHAVQKGLLLRADVLYLVTDSDDLSDRDVQALTRQNGGRTAIHAVELSRRRADADGPLQRLATQNGGTFRRVPPAE